MASPPVARSGGSPVFPPSRPILVLVLAAALALPVSTLAAPPPVMPLPPPIPEVLEGFAIQPLAAFAGTTTALAFGPGDADGPDLYATAGSDVVRVPLMWTAAGPVPTGPAESFVAGFQGPLGLTFDASGGALYVSDSHSGAESGRTDGRVTRVVAGVKEVVVDGLPNGRHNTNHLRFGPDGRLYIANGNPNDNGVDGGEADVLPYSGAILSVDTAQVAASPAVLHWQDTGGNAIPPSLIASNPRNADFASKVSVLAHGFRNVFGIAFHPTLGIGYTAMNGQDTPSSQDTFYRLTPGTDYGFPFCHDRGIPGDVGAAITKAANPIFPGTDCTPYGKADALLGWHVCATGIDFPTPGPWEFPAAFQNSAFVGECGPFQPDDALIQGLNGGLLTHNTGHKVVRLALDANGHATDLHDFITGLGLPTDVRFGPDGAMYIADAVVAYRVAPGLGPTPGLVATP